MRGPFPSLCLLLSSAASDEHLKSPGGCWSDLFSGLKGEERPSEGGVQTGIGNLLAAPEVGSQAADSYGWISLSPLSMPIPAIRLCLPSNETYSSSSGSLVALKLTLQHSQLNPQGPLCA